MRQLFAILAGLFLGVGLFAHGGGDYPFRFIENRGQWPGGFQYKAEIPMGAMFFESTGLTYHLADFSELHERHVAPQPDAAPPVIRAHAFKVLFEGANGSAQWRGEHPESYYLNFFMGQDQSKWAAQVHPMRSLRALEIWEGVDIHYYGIANSLKYDFHLAPGVPASRVKLRFQDATALRIENEMLVIETSLGEIREMPPVAWQIIREDTVYVPCSYKLEGNLLSFKMQGRVDPRYGITIDPSLVFGSFSGSTTDNWGFTATYDDLGFLYSGGVANGIGYPTTPGAYQTVWNGGHGFVFPSDVTLTKYDTTGSFLIWSTYLGGSGSELPHSIICNSLNELFIYGTTGSADFPVTTGSFQPTFNGGSANTTTTMNVNYNSGSDIFVSRLNATGTALLASTYVGGTGNDGLNAAAPLRYNYADEVRGEIIIDNQNNIYVASTTRSTDFPVTAGCFQPANGGGQDGVVFKMDNSLTTMLWASYFGGSGNDAVYALDLYSNNDIIITGGTSSQNLPTQNSAFTAYNGGNCDGFVAKINSAGTSILHAMYVGSPGYDQSYLIELDANDDIYVFGQTTATGNFWINNAVFNVPGGGQFIRKYSANFQTIVWSTAFGTGNGTPDISPSAFLVDVCNKIYISGWGGAVNAPYYPGSTTNGLPITPGAFQTTTDGSDYYLMVMEDNANSLVYATFYGGGISAEHVDGGTSRFSRSGQIYQSVCAGCGANSDFPTSPGAWSSVNSSPNCNNGVFKFSFDFPTTLANFTIPGAICANDPLPITNNSSGATSYLWDFGDGNTSTAANPAHSYAQAGQYQVKLVATDGTAVTCNLSDSLIRNVVVIGDASDSLATANICPGDAINIGVQPNNDPSITYSWSPSAGLSNTTIANPIATPPANTTYTLLISNGLCTDTLIQEIVVSPLPPPNPGIDTLCLGESIALGLTGDTSGISFVQWTPSVGISNPNSLQVIASPGSDIQYQLVYGNNTCFDSVLYEVVVTQGASFSMPERILCPGDSLMLDGFDTTGRFNFAWTPPTNLDNPTLPFPNAFPPQDQTYQLIMDNGLCSDTVRVPLRVVEPANLNGNDTTICLGDALTIGNSGGPVTSFTYLWSPSAGLSDPTSPSPLAEPTQSTTYVLNVHLAGFPAKCQRSDTVTVNVIQDIPEAGFTWNAVPSCTGMRVTLIDESQNSQDIRYIVNGDTLPSGETTVLVPYGQTVSITQIAMNGPCAAAAVVSYSPGSFADNYSFEMPNVFTPFISPGLNDRFCPVGFDGDYCYDMIIYNRWGSVVYESSESKPCWEGFILSTGLMAIEGVYYYVLKTFDGETFQGFVHLFRTE